MYKLIYTTVWVENNRTGLWLYRVICQSSGTTLYNLMAPLWYHRLWGSIQVCRAMEGGGGRGGEGTEGKGTEGFVGTFIL